MAKIQDPFSDSKSTPPSSVVGILPHGGVLIDRVISAQERKESLRVAAALPVLDLTSRQVSDLLLLAVGGFSPLTGFMNYETSRSVVENFSTVEGILWSIPILFQVDSSVAKNFTRGSRVALRFNGSIVGTLAVEDRFAVPLTDWAKKIFKTDETIHPGVTAILQSGDTALGGPIEWLAETDLLGHGAHWKTPGEVRAEIARRGWKTIAGFQTRNPVHRAHEYVLRTALEVTDGLLLHPLVGETRAEDIPADLRLRCYQALLENYFPSDTVLFSVLPAWMRYGGPREAVLHALVRKNFGCTHFLVGRDHAGVGKYYGPYEAQQLLRSLGEEQLGIRPLAFDEVFYCRRCQSMASRRTCRHSNDDHLILSGTEVRRRLREGLSLPGEFTRPEIAALLAEGFRSEAAHA